MASILGRDALFYFRGRIIRFEVLEPPPLMLSYSHRGCATGAVEKLDLVLLEIERHEGTAIYRVLGCRD